MRRIGRLKMAPGAPDAPGAIRVVVVARRNVRSSRRRRTMGHTHQIHFWLGDDDYDFLRDFAYRDDSTMGSVLRRLVRG